MFVDVHCHLDLCKNVEEVLDRASEKNTRVVCAGVDVKTNRQALKFAEKEGVECCLGIYPMDTLKMSEEEIDEEIEFIKESKNKIVGIGEVGLDRHETKDEKDWEGQEKAFRKFIRLAVELDKVVVIHSRKAEERAIEILEEEKAGKVVMHCFCGKWKLVEKIVQNGWLVTVPTNITRSEQFQKIAKDVKIENLLCETDAPFLHPESGKGMTNEPGNVIASYEKIAELKGMDLEEVEGKIERNFERVFS